jgi:hypothetical protein
VTIVLFGWLACSGKDGGPQSADSADTAETAETLPFAPSSGTYQVTMASTFSGDCALDDPKTGSTVADTWDLLIEGDQIRLWQNSAPSTLGVMDGLDFSFDLGHYAFDYSAHGIDAFETIQYSVRGTFDTATSFTGTYDIAATCEGSGCPEIAAFYGSAFTYPCVATAPFEGVAAR